MNTLQEIPRNELDSFKEKVKTWIDIDNEILLLEKKSRELKKIRNKQLEPEITKFMTQFNITDLNTENGKLKCNQRNTKKALNKNNIKENLTKVIQDIHQVEQAMDLIINNREIVTTYKLVKAKK
tara:strand:- start:175 stop:549 length:375 start_codon:yes stop_codon:yes gene_type:complete